MNKVYQILKEGRKRILTQYVKLGDNETSATRSTVPTLEAGIYDIKDTMRGLEYHKHDINTDEILRFEDSRYNQIINEIDNFWSLEENFKEMGFTHKRGVLLFGAPGQGKSCLLKMVIESMVNRGD